MLIIYKHKPHPNKTTTFANSRDLHFHTLKFALLKNSNYICTFINTNPIAMDLVNRLKFFLEKNNIAISQFADTCGIPRPTLSQILNGRNKKISDELISKIHAAYPALSVLWLMFGEGSMDADANTRISELKTPAKPTRNANIALHMSMMRAQRKQQRLHGFFIRKFRGFRHDGFCRNHRHRHRRRPHAGTPFFNTGRKSGRKQRLPQRHRDGGPFDIRRLNFILPAT